MSQIVKDILISRVGLEGQGVGYGEGKIYFVRGALPGDRVQISHAPTTKRYIDGFLDKILAPSPQRINSSCSYFGECGGCDWLNWSYEAQLTAKDEMLTHVLERGAFLPRLRKSILGSDKILGYRNRVQIRRQNKRIGFYKKRSHEVVDIESCAVAHPRLNEELRLLRREESDSNEKIELVLKDGDAVERVSNAPHAVLGFTQANSSQNEVLRSVIASLVESLGGKRILELYCGDGNLTLAYAPFVERVFAVDSNSPAISIARDRLKLVHPAAVFLAHSIDDRLFRKLPAEGLDYDTLILDPPRDGLGGRLTDFVKTARNIIYVSCSPVSFSTDVQPLKKLGFTFEELQAIDMFPQTRHVEFVGTFIRKR